MLIAQGAEAGGHGVARGTLTFVPAVVDIAHGIPVVAAGGIADGRGLAAALMLGADGVLLGTRFYATQEAAGADAAKARSVAASGDGTVATSGRNPTPRRVLRNEFSDRWRGRDAELLQQRDAEGARHARARDERLPYRRSDRSRSS